MRVIFGILCVICASSALTVVTVADEWVITEGPAGPPVIARDDPDEVPPEPIVFAEPVAEVVTPDYFVVFTTKHCSPCRLVKLHVIPALKARGYTVVEIDTNSDAQWGVATVPTIWRANNKVRQQQWVGYTSADVLLQSVQRPVKVVPQAMQPAVIQQPAQVQVRARLPVVSTQWGVIDLETYARNCNCSMCQGIRALQQQWRQQLSVMNRVTQQPAAAAQAIDPLPQYAPTPVATVQHMLSLMDLDDADILVDLGCGNASVLLAAVRYADCKCIGVEIDPDKADEARLNVEKAGLSHMITIITGDALEFIPADHGVTAAVAYLYPDVLEQLSPALQQIAVVATPYHAVPGLPMQQFGDVWIYKRNAVSATTSYDATLSGAREVAASQAVQWQFHTVP